MSLKGTPGASLRVLRDYFPIANIYGVDIDSTVLFEEDRIKTFQMDQTSIESISTFIRQVNFTKFDLVIDDGLHTFEAGVKLFEGIQPCLNSNFKYVIEDVYGVEVSKYVEYFAFQDYSMQVIELYREKKSHKKKATLNVLF
jgi:23S rRNA U2552 (ribose-2'-O)-methylase RlmE/FtsJ